MPDMTPKLTKAIHAVEKLPQARQDALADLLLEAAAQARTEEAAAIAELRALLAAAEASGVGGRSMEEILAAARSEARRRGLPLGG